MSLVMRKPDCCMCENKDADQRRGDREADQRLCFRYMDSTIPLLSKSEIFCGCTARFVSDLVRNPEDRFSHNEANMIHDIIIILATKRNASSKMLKNLLNEYHACSRQGFIFFFLVLVSPKNWIRRLLVPKVV